VELSEALHKANQILVEERSSPTVQYSLRLKDGKPTDSLGQFADAVAILREPELLKFVRSHRPRDIVENPNRWAFQSVNYNLLCALLSQLPGDSRAAFLAAVLGRLATPPGCAKAKKDVQPSWNGLVSEFPLVAEFCVRNGATDLFLRSLGEAKLILGHAVLLRHIEDMIALNFTVLTERDYGSLDTAMTTLRYTAVKALIASEKDPPGSETRTLCGELIRASEGISEECRKAQYLYLKGALLEGLNLEVNQDKVSVESYLKAQGFSDVLIECLNRADRLYHGASSGFDFKSAMGHLRSFMEKLHSEGLTRFNVPAASSDAIRWGDGLERLQQQGLLTKAEKGYAAALFTLLSDEGVHPIMAEKEYARLARNVVIEYALLFLRKLPGQVARRGGAPMPRAS
jgi:hypothetical protein